jgi:hypothetical protein
MKLRLMLVLAVVALTFGLSQPAPADPPGITPKQCDDICALVRCAYPTTCGLYVDNGQTVCGCH